MPFTPFEKVFNSHKRRIKQTIKQTKWKKKKEKIESAKMWREHGWVNIGVNYYAIVSWKKKKIGRISHMHSRSIMNMYSDTCACVYYAHTNRIKHNNNENVDKF